MTYVPPERFNMVDYFLDERLREGRGDRIAIRSGDQTFTYHEVASRTARFGSALLELGVRPEERILIAHPDTVDFAAALLGVIKIGAVAVMINPDLRPDHLGAIVSASRAPAAVVHIDHVAAVEAALEHSDHGPRLLVVGGTAGAHREFDPAVYPDDLATQPMHRDDPAIWLFSGGTTGTPKAVVQTHRSFVNTTERYAKEALGYGEEDITLSVPRLYFGYATGSNLLFPFSVGASAVLFSERPSPDVLFREIAAHRPTILVNVPSMVNQMVSYPDAANQDLSSLRFATSAGEALPETLYHRWKEAFGVELLDGLGTAEMWHIFVSNLPGDVRPGTVGRVVPGFTVMICDEEGDEVPDGEVGRLWVRGDSRALCYWQNMELTAAAFRGEWFVGGDLASRDTEGHVTHRGRADDAIKVKGKWLQPQEVESCLLDHPVVVECAVIAVEDDAGLLKPVAFVVPTERRPGLEEELQRHVLDRMEPYKHPRVVHLVEALPQTHLGKVDRGALREMAAPAAT